MASKITWVEAQKEHAEWHMQELCYIMKMTEEEYLEMQYNYCIEYLELYLPNHPIERRAFEADRIFWNWFKNEWARRDYVFIDSDPYSLSVENIRLLYRNMHNPAQLACTLTPGRVVMEPILKTTIHSL